MRDRDRYLSFTWARVVEQNERLFLGKGVDRGCECLLSWGRNIYIILGMSLTCALQAKGLLQGGDQGELALLTESAGEVIQINGPDHGASKFVLHKPAGLIKDEDNRNHLISWSSGLGPHHGKD